MLQFTPPLFGTFLKSNLPLIHSKQFITMPLITSLLLAIEWLLSALKAVISNERRVLQFFRETLSFLSRKYFPKVIH